MDINKIFKIWCQETKRSGGILVGSSIKEFFIFYENIKDKELENFAKWFNENQWVEGKGDRVKGLFVKCKYKEIVNEYNQTQ